MQTSPRVCRRNSVLGEWNYVCGALSAIWLGTQPLQWENLAQFLILYHPGQVIVVQCLDDVFLVSVDRGVWERDTSALVTNLRIVGWVVCPKSVIVPSSEITWMGKNISGHGIPWRIALDT